LTRFDILFGIVTLLPAALNATPVQAQSALTARLCTGDGAVRTIQIPVGNTGIPGSDQPGCCAKGCHSGSSRKRGVRKLDSSQ